MSRPYDIVLFGATGFTGRLVAEYLARASTHESFRWALAGRSMEKLEALRGQLPPLASDKVPALLEADVDHPASLQAMASATRVLISAIGPYLRFGGEVLAACVAAGTHYTDLTVEVEFVAKSRATYHETARKNGLRIVHCCGFGSITYDLGVLFTLDELRKRIGDASYATSDVRVRSYLDMSMRFSAGTWSSYINQLHRFRQYLEGVRSLTSQNEPRVSAIPPRLNYDRALRRWACPVPVIDEQIVGLSAQQRGDYGGRFANGYYLLSPHLLLVVVGVFGVAMLAALCQSKALASLLRRLMPGGEGPSAETRAASWFCMKVVASAAHSEVSCNVSGGDPGYDEASKMIAESALAIALDSDLPPNTGVVTPAAGIGHPLLRRLQRAGLRFAIVR